jgi:BolA family transcriptional regulator, general stress-responsive regulator
MTATHQSGYGERIHDKLTAALAPVRLEVTDQSHLHAGHAGARPEGETHFHVLVVSERFTGLGRVDRQRLVYAAVADELAEHVHALSISALDPCEDSGAVHA